MINGKNSYFPKFSLRFGLTVGMLLLLLAAAITVQALDLAGRPTLGPDSAKVKIVEVSDFQCRHCASLAPVLHEVVQQYGDLVQFSVVTIAVNGPYAEMAA